ncbi:MAG TPA: LETM1-related biofilm-associated protein [Flavobacterium sp.]|nr:LETM1-related biofilm-associated protein [Flavobacterium sp.]
MINPSAHGWIDKFFTEQKGLLKKDPVSPDTFYKKVRETGFIFGHVVSFDVKTPIETKGRLRDEVSKIALLNTLYGMFCLISDDKKPAAFIPKAVSFYNEMNPQGHSIFRKVFPNESLSQNLEQIIDQRVRTNHDIVSKNFSHIVTNALLFIDVLAFQQYLQHGVIPEKYLKKIEETIISIITLALKTKSIKSQHDDLLIRLFEASVRYSKFSKVSVQNPEALKLDYFTNDLEKYYFIDLAGMTLWSDGMVEKDEAYFLYKLGELMNVGDDFVTEGMVFTNQFITEHKKEIPYFNYSNPVKNFYDNITQSVIVLITRNKNRLVKEISQSRELMVLLAQSTHRDLDAKEKKKVKTQILDICKTIPSLTIFLLPGGGLLLPILIKFIPKMLPSAFNENNESE